MRDNLEKMQQLAAAIAERDGKLMVIEREKNPGPWTSWRDWRIRNGAPIGYMDSAGKMTVPTEYPPVDLDAALRQTKPATLRERLGK